MGLKRFIDIEFQKGGVHRYPAALEEPSLADVKYLGHEHFHYFYFYVRLEVFHNDRDIEFQQFRKWCESLYAGGDLRLDYKSCEMMAEELIEAIQEEYGTNRDVAVCVYEDNINGAELVYTKE